MGPSLVFGSALGPLAAAQLVDALGYRGLFGALAVAGGISTLTLVAFVPETLPPERRVLPATPAMELAAVDAADVDGDLSDDE